MRKADESMMRFRLVAAAIVSVALLVPLGIFAGIGFNQSSAAAAEYQYKVTVCHHTASATNPTVTISISVNAWPAHQAHGDTLGAC